MVQLFSSGAVSSLSDRTSLCRFFLIVSGIFGSNTTNQPFLLGFFFFCRDFDDHRIISAWWSQTVSPVSKKSNCSFKLVTLRGSAGYLPALMFFYQCRVSLYFWITVFHDSGMSAGSSHTFLRGRLLAAGSVEIWICRKTTMLRIKKHLNGPNGSRRRKSPGHR